jgi:single-strand DNA-binding protein
MNSFILMAQIVQEPQLRFTADQMAIAEMLVEFAERGNAETPSRLKVVGWGNLAQEIQKSYHQGDRVIIEGRLTMNSVQADGYKEKRAELTVQKIYPLGAGIDLGSASSADSSLSASDDYEMRSPATVGSYNPTPPRDTYEESASISHESTRPEPLAPPPDYSTDNDDIPF